MTRKGDHHELSRRSLEGALEKTVPAEQFSPEGLRRELERTATDHTPEATPGRFLDPTGTDPTPQDDAGATDNFRGFDDTTLLPPELLVESSGGGARFALSEELGKGGTARVYALRDQALGRTVALKLLRGKAAGRPGLQQRFIHEARVTAMLEHPNIIPVYDIGLTPERRVFYLMKNVSGVTVGDAVRAARDTGEVPKELGTVDGRIGILLKVCDAIEYAHDHGFVHQDIKPDNIMLGGYGEVLVLDWGCALSTDPGVHGAVESAFGTPAYMSPEQARRERVDERSDIYCMGATLYHMLTLHYPTWADDPERFWEMKRRGELTPPPPDVRRTVPQPLLDITARALATDPADRYQSIAQLRAALLEYRAHAESIGIARRASGRIDEASREGDYQAFADIAATLRHALDMWDGNTVARTGLLDVTRAHAECALARDDLQLADTLARLFDELDDVRRRVAAQRKRREGRRRKLRLLTVSLSMLAVAVLGFAGFYVVDYFRYFGTWQLVTRVEFADLDVDRNAVLFTAYDFVDREDSTRAIESPHPLDNGDFLWLRDVRIRGDVRLEALVRWPGRVDGLEMHLNARRAKFFEPWWCPAGYSCQFGGFENTLHLISRNPTPGPPDQGNIAGTRLEPNRWYRLAFQRIGDELAMYVDGDRVLRVTEPLPLTGDGLHQVAIRSWDRVHIREVSVYRRSAPAKTSPLIAGDILVERGYRTDAIHVYQQLALDHRGTAIAEQALVRAYLLIKPDVPASDSLRRAIREQMSALYPDSRSWSHIYRVDCLDAWREGELEQAFELAAKDIDRDPDSRIALQLVARRSDLRGTEYGQRLVELVGRTRSVTSLDLRHLGITDITPLEGLPLTNLNLCNNSIRDLSPLRGMPLRSLAISTNHVHSLEPLRGMPLELLTLTDNQVSDLSPVAGMPLISLHCSLNPCTTLSALSGMPLVDLSADRTGIETLEPLRGLPLRKLVVSNNPGITSLEPLRGMSIEHLDIDGCRVASLEPLRGLPLKVLKALGNGISDLSPLEDLPLTDVLVARNQIDDLSPLRRQALDHLDISYNSVQSLEPLRGARLERLTMRHNEVGSLEPLRGMRVRVLLLDDNPVESLLPLAGMPLEELSCPGAPLLNLEPFEERPPPMFRFDSVQAPPPYLVTVLDAWTESGDTANVRRARILLAARRRDARTLQDLAVAYEGHEYLYVFRQMPFETAVGFAESVGAHLVTVTSRQEQNFVISQVPYSRGSWLNLSFDTRSGNRWLTGEPFTFQDFHRRWYRHVPGRNIILSRHSAEGIWFPLSHPDDRCEVMLEWE